MILVTDATGFVGRAVVRRLAAEQREVCCLLRPSRREQRLPADILFSTVSASMSDLPALRTAMHGVTAVVHLVGAEDAEHGRRLRNCAKETANLVEAACEAGVRRFIHLSRLGADRLSAYPLFRARGEAEAAVHGSGLDYTIIRAAVAYGPEDAFTNVLAMLAKAIPFVFPIPDVGLCRFQPLWIVDLARCIVAALDRDDLIGQTIHLGGPEHFNLEQMVAAVLAAVEVRKRLVRVRMPLIQVVIELCDLLLPRTPTPRWWLDLLTVGSATELVTIPRHFGFAPAPFVQSLDYLRRKRPWRRDLARFVLGYH